MPRILLPLNNPFSGHWRLRWHLQDGNMNEIIRNGVTSMESGARKAPFMGSQYCLLNNPRPGLLTGHWSDLESWYSELYRASLFKERWSGLDTSLVVFTSACMEEAAISVCPLITHMSDVTLDSSHQTGGMWQIIQCVDYFAHLKKLKCWGDKWPCLRNRQQSGWLSRHRGQTDVDNSAPKTGQDLYDQHFKPSLVWMISKSSLHIQQWSLELVDLYT